MAFDRHHRSHVFTFLLPKGARVELARSAADVFGCLFEIGRYLGLVSIYGRSKEAVFAQGAEIIQRACDADQRYAISANLYVGRHGGELDDERDWLLIGGGVDGWTIIVIGGQAAFAPTALGAEFPLTEDNPVVTAAPAAAIRS